MLDDSDLDLRWPCFELSLGDVGTRNNRPFLQIMGGDGLTMRAFILLQFAE